MSARLRERTHDNHLAFYRDVYGGAVREVRCAGRVGTTLFTTEQAAGDWSDAATPDLVISVVRGAAGPANLDLGSGRFRASTIASGEFVVVAPNAATDIIVDDHHALLLLGVPYAGMLTLAGADAGLPVDGDFGRLHRGTHRDQEVERLINKLWSEAGHGNAHGALCADGVLLQLAAALLRLSQQRRNPPRGGLAPFRLRRALEYLEANLDRDVTLAELAAEVGLSPHHFCTAFRRTTGEPPHRFLLKRRIDRAKALLSTGTSIAETALICGFASQQHLTTVFRNVVGTPPGAWRRDAPTTTYLRPN